MSQLDRFKQVLEKVIPEVNKKEKVLNNAMQLQLTMFFNEEFPGYTLEQTVLIFDAFQLLHFKSNAYSPIDYTNKLYKNNQDYQKACKSYNALMRLVNNFADSVEGKKDRNSQLKVIEKFQSLLIQQELSSRTVSQEKITEPDKIDFKEISALLAKMALPLNKGGLYSDEKMTVEKDIVKELKTYFEEVIFPLWRDSPVYSQLDFGAEIFDIEAPGRLAKISPNYFPEKSKKIIEAVPIKAFKSEILEIAETSKDYGQSSDVKTNKLYMNLYYRSHWSSPQEYTKCMLAALDKIQNFINAELEK